MDPEEQLLQQKSSSFKKQILMIVGVVIVLAIGGYVFYIFSSRVSANEVATMTAKFVDSALDEKTGTFNLFFECDRGNGTCAPINNDEPPHMGYSIMSLKLVGEETGNTAYITKADTILKTALERCETDTKYCEWNFFPLFHYYKETGDPLYRDAMVKLGDLLLAERSFGDLVSQNIPVKWWRLYDITKEEKYKDRLLIMADKVLENPISDLTKTKEVYTTGGFSVDNMVTQTIWAVVVPAYRVSNDEKYLAFAETYFDKAKIEDNADKFLVSQTGAAALIKGLEAILDISSLDASQSSTYMARAKKISEFILQKGWDTPNRKLANGDYGILVSPTRKATNLQGWFTVLLLKLGTEKLSIR